MKYNEELENLDEWERNLLKDYFLEEDVKRFTFEGERGLFVTWAQLHDILYDARKDGYEDACETAARYM